MLALLSEAQEKAKRFLLSLRCTVESDFFDYYIYKQQFNSTKCKTEKRSPCNTLIKPHTLFKLLSFCKRQQLRGLQLIVKPQSGQQMKLCNFPYLYSHSTSAHFPSLLFSVSVPSLLSLSFWGYNYFERDRDSRIS